MEIHARTILPLLAVMLIPTIDIIDYIPDNKDNWNPYGIAVNTRKVCIVYKAFITGSEQLRSNEHIVDINDLENLYSNEWRFFYDDIQGMWYS